MPKGSEQKPDGRGMTRDPQQESEKFRNFFSTSVAQVPEALCRAQETKNQDSGRISLSRLLGRGPKTDSRQAKSTERATQCLLGDSTGEILLVMEDQQPDQNPRPARQTREVYGAVPLLEDLERVLGADSDQKPAEKPKQGPARQTASPAGSQNPSRTESKAPFQASPARQTASPAAGQNPSRTESKAPFQASPARQAASPAGSQNPSRTESKAPFQASPARQTASPVRSQNPAVPQPLRRSQQVPQEDQKLLDFKALLDGMDKTPSQSKQGQAVTLADLEARLKSRPDSTPAAFFASDVLTEEAALRSGPRKAAPAQEVKAKPVQAAPAQEVKAKPVQAAPAQEVKAKPVQTAPAQEVKAKPVQAAPAQEAKAKPVQAAPAQEVKAKPVQAAPAQEVKTKPVQAAPAQEAKTKPVQAAPAEEAQTKPAQQTKEVPAQVQEPEEKPAAGTKTKKSWKDKLFRFFGPAEDELPAASAESAAPAEAPAEEKCPEDTLSLPLIGLEEDAAPAASAPQPDKTEEPKEPQPPEAQAETPPQSDGEEPAEQPAPAESGTESEVQQTEQTAEEVGRDLHSTGAALTLRCALSGILAAALLGMGFVFEGLLPPLAMLDPVSAPTAFLGANLLLLLAAMAVAYSVLRDGLSGLRGAPSLDTLPALAALGALVQAVAALMQAESYQASSYRLMSGAAALLLALDLLGSRVMLAAVQGGYELIQSGVEHQGAFRVKDPDLIRCLSADLEEKDPWILLSRPVRWAASFIDQSFSPRACEKTARKLSWLVLGCSILAALAALLTGRGTAGASAALAAMLCLGAPLSATLIAGLSSLRMQHDAGRVGAVIPGWAAVEELGGVDTLQLDARDLFAPDSAQLKDIRIFKGGRIDRAILYAASVLNQGCNTLSGLFRQIIEDRTDILLPVKDLERRPGLGFAAWCDSQHILIGTRAFMEQEEIPLPEPEYEAKHSQNGAYQVLYLAVSGNLHAMFVVQYIGGRHAAHCLSLLNKENIRLLVSCEDPSLTAEKIAAAYHLPEGMVTVLGADQLAALRPVQQYAAEADCCMIHLKGFASLTEGLCAAERAQSAELLGTRVQAVSVILSMFIGLLLTYAGNIGLLSLAVVLMYQAAWSALSIAIAAMKQHG